MKGKQPIASLRSDCNLFSHLFYDPQVERSIFSIVLLKYWNVV